MSITIHIVNSPEPLVWRGEDREAICKAVVEGAVPANIVPDVMLCSVGMIASTFSPDMCPDCQFCDDPEDGWVYFVMTKEDAKKLQRQRDLAEAI